MATVTDILLAREGALRTVLAAASSNLLANSSIPDARNEIIALAKRIADQELVSDSSADLDRSLKVIEAATSRMSSALSRYHASGGASQFLSELLEFGDHVVRALAIISAPLYRCSFPGCGNTSTTQSYCHSRLMTRLNI